MTQEIASLLLVVEMSHTNVDGRLQARSEIPDGSHDPQAQAAFVFHIPKTGGRSIFDTFRTHAGAGRVLFIVDPQTDKLEGRVRTAFQEHGTVLFNSHVSPLALPAMLGLLRVVVLRDLVERAISKFCAVYGSRHDLQKHYDYLHRCDGYLASRFTLRDVVGWVEELKNDNDQIRYLANHHDGVVDQTVFERARHALDTCEFVGVTEELDTCIAMLADAISVSIPHTIKTNVTNRDIIAADAGELRAALRPYFTYDDVLYAVAKERFEMLKSRVVTPSHRASIAEPVLRHGLTMRERAVAALQANPAELGLRVASRLRRAKNVTIDYATRIAAALRVP